MDIFSRDINHNLKLSPLRLYHFIGRKKYDLTEFFEKSYKPLLFDYQLLSCSNSRIVVRNESIVVSKSDS